MKNFIIALTVIVIVHYLFFLFGFSFVDGTNANFYMDNNLTLEKKGVFGDFTSGHFSILAFIWLAYGIYIQSQEFKLQREEFQNQTEQFKEQNKLYEQQMKELEIQSIQNQFDRKIAKLTEIEYGISQTLDISTHGQNGLYIFFMNCKYGHLNNNLLIKIEMVYTYLNLYVNLLNFIKISQSKIDLIEELEILKKDIYTNMKISFLILLGYMQLHKKNKTLFEEPNPFESLSIYHTLLSLDIKDFKDIVPEIRKLTDNFVKIDTINVLEKFDNT
ncbi:MAG: hypothetical protein JW802_03950 [Campylobacterales bacterium]|nr:hypothetical protein [Campylobacterales bacterium]MBN2833230.1 hypothetical protein [Campylobacterales bacterium]